jgi:hypothetical protein
MMGYRADELPVYLPRFYVQAGDVGYTVCDRYGRALDGAPKLVSFGHTVHRALEIAHALNQEQAET